MFDRLEIRVLPPGPRWAAEIRIRVNGEDVIDERVGEGGRGPLAAHALPFGRPDSLWATEEPHRVELGEPICTGGCCGFLAVVVERHGEIVRWSDWEVPVDGGHVPYPPPEFYFDARRYDAEVGRAGAEFGRQTYGGFSGA